MNKPMIVSLRGCSGAGKTTVAREIMNRFPTTEVRSADSKKVMGYRVETTGTEFPLYIVGSYTTVCGGCDKIATFQEIIDRIMAAYNDGYNVLFEGLLLSGKYGSIGAISEVVENYTFAALDTPLEVCLERVRVRREARGKLEPMNPKNTTDAWNGVQNVMKKMLANPAKKAVWLDHTNPTEQVLGLLK